MNARTVKISHARLPTRHGVFKACVYKAADSPHEHLAMVMGDMVLFQERRGVKPIERGARRVSSASSLSFSAACSVMQPISEICVSLAAFTSSATRATVSGSMPKD